MVALRELLEEMFQRNASDLHLTVGVPPAYRVDGMIIPSEHDDVPLEPVTIVKVEQGTPEEIAHGHVH